MRCFSLQKFLGNGIMMRLRNKASLTEPVENKAYRSVRIVNVVPILSILCMGIILSILILILENIYYRYKKMREEENRQLKAFYRLKKQPFIIK